VCNEKVTGDHKGIECEMCKQFHAACEDIEDEEYEVLSRHARRRRRNLFATNNNNIIQ